MTVEMAYSPPFSSAIDSINAAAYVADNLCAGLLRKVDLNRFLAWMEDFGREAGLGCPGYQASAGGVRLCGEVRPGAVAGHSL